MDTAVVAILLAVLALVALGGLALQVYGLSGRMRKLNDRA
jgi:hypothetical protein